MRRGRTALLRDLTRPCIQRHQAALGLDFDSGIAAAANNPFIRPLTHQAALDRKRQFRQCAVSGQIDGAAADHEGRLIAIGITVVDGAASFEIGPTLVRILALIVPAEDRRGDRKPVAADDCAGARRDSDRVEMAG